MNDTIMFPQPNCTKLSSDDLSHYRHHMKNVWKNFVKTTPPTAAQMMLRNIVLGYDPLRGFSPIKNPNKLLNGMTQYSSALQALWMIKNADLSTWKVFIPEISSDARLLPSQRLWQDSASEWTQHLSAITDQVRLRNREACHEATI